MDDIEIMHAALEEAQIAASKGEVPVGAVVVVNGEIIARRHNQRESDHDPTSHAEILALQDASKVIGELALIRLVIAQCVSKKSFPNAIFAISTVSCARSG